MTGGGYRGKSMDEKRAHAIKAGRKGAERSKYPLRARLGTIQDPEVTGYTMPLDLLECGHWALKSEDGAPSKRRCKKCFDGKPPEVDVNDYTPR